MSEAVTYVEAFKSFESSLNGQSEAPIHQIRRKAIDTFGENGFPTAKDESWKSINLSPLTDSFAVAKRPTVPLSSDTLRGLDLDLGGPLLVFVDGYFDESNSQLCETDGLVVSSIAQELENQDSTIHDRISSIASIDDHPFAALNTAFLSDGAFVHVSKGKVVEEVIHVVYVSTSTDGSPTVSYPRSLFVAEESSQITIVETFAGGTGTYLTNHVAEIIVGKNAILDHYKVGLEGDEARHVSNQQSHQGRSSSLRSHSISIGGQFLRNDVISALDGEACESTINGLYVLNGKQHCDNYTLLEHRQPNCPSHELYKGILTDDARAVFRGKIHVHQIAQKTDAYQQNQNVLLSDNARVNTKPQLEIYADDVKCSHGATIGQIDNDAIFYLQARGIGREAAHRMLLEAFANDVLSRIKVDALRQTLSRRVFDKIGTPA